MKPIFAIVQGTLKRMPLAVLLCSGMVLLVPGASFAKKHNTVVEKNASAIIGGYLDKQRPGTKRRNRVSGIKKNQVLGTKKNQVLGTKKNQMPGTKNQMPGTKKKETKRPKHTRSKAIRDKTRYTQKVKRQLRYLKLRTRPLFDSSRADRIAKFSQKKMSKWVRKFKAATVTAGKVYETAKAKGQVQAAEAAAILIAAKEKFLDAVYRLRTARVRTAPAGT